MKNVLAAILLLLALSGKGQDLLRLNISTPSNTDKLPVHLSSARFYPDSISLRAGLDSVLTQIAQLGFFDAELNKLKAVAEGFTAEIHLGELFFWHLKNANIGAEALRQANIEHYFSGAPLPHHRFSEIQKLIVGWYENNGYPFASLHTDSIVPGKNHFEAVLRIDLNQRIVFGPVQLQGNVRLSEGFIAGLTGIVTGKPYSEQKAREAQALLNELPFMRLNIDAEIQFHPGTAILKIPASRIPSNRFDGIAGVTSNSLDQNRLQLTGQLNLQLINIFERGETFSMNWLGMGQGTQRLLLEGTWPFLFRTPLSPSMLFSLHKQDTSYISLRQRPSFSWQSPNRIELAIFADLQSTQLLSTSRFSEITTIPPQIDSRISLFGIEASTYSQGFFSTMHTGRGLKVWAAAGTKKVTENASLPAAVYQKIIPSQNKYAFGLEAETRIRATRQSSVVFHLRSQGMTSRQFFENELFRIGGFRTLKGFDEESILASAFTIMTGEWRYFIGENSYFSLLFNAAWFERNLGETYNNGWPWGGGAGITLQTAPGIISVYYALGKSPEIPFAFRNAKVHIGFVSLF